jgi:hypothetical protein
MEVFLIPSGGPRYELYCEAGSEPAAPPRQSDTGQRLVLRLAARWRRWLVDRFIAIVTSVEAAKHDAAHRRATGQRRTLARRIRDRVVCWLAEKVAEQRLLWHLRGQEQVTAWFPDDMDERQAADLVRQMLQADAERHLRWLVVNSLGLAGSLILIPVPGPNILLYYFIFRVVGHYLSRLGARHGLDRVDWQVRPSGALTDLRQAIALAPDVRRRRVTEIASRLRLQHLAAFLERVAMPVP